MARLMVSHLTYPQPYTRIGRPHRLTYPVGASSSLARFKYSAVHQRRPGSRAKPAPAPSLPDHDLKSIQDTIEGLRLMSHLKYVRPSPPPPLPLLTSPQP